MGGVEARGKRMRADRAQSLGPAAAAAADGSSCTAVSTGLGFCDQSCMHALAPHACMHPLTPLPVHACMQAKQAFEEQQEEVRIVF